MLYDKIKSELSLIDGKIKYLLVYAAYNPDVIIFDEIKAKIIGFCDFTDNNPVRVLTQDDVIINVMLKQIKLCLKPLARLDEFFFTNFYEPVWFAEATKEDIDSEIISIYYDCLQSNLRQNVFTWLLQNKFDVFNLINKGFAVDRDAFFTEVDTF